MAADLSRILVIGSTGYFGKFMVDASVRLGHPTFAMVRQGTYSSNPEKAALIDSFKSRGVNLVYGDIYEREKLMAALKQVDVVICTLSHRTPHLYEDEVMLIEAIKQVGNIKRYIPSEFGFDVERLDIMEPAKSTLSVKARVRQRIREEGVPHTIVCGKIAANWHFLPRIGQVEGFGPPADKIHILGDGNTKAVFVREEDTATYTVKAADDPRTLNKIMYLRPPGCVISHNELIDLWEKKTGKKLERIYIPEHEVVTKMEDSSPGLRGCYMVAHASFVKGQTMIDIDPLIGVEASELYPEVKYASIGEILNTYL
ncbi:hypothetical protein KSP39_PZI008617 [Platanthera zijinensis]|uniref:NmrA-like domain-containing protein n=1 Tax=Platanthera zijinensis TaxID=2320716 RepID=A0AAP0BLL6_9ASPA